VTRSAAAHTSKSGGVSSPSNQHTSINPEATCTISTGSMSSAAPQKYIPSIRETDGSPPRTRKRRGSDSPETREYETQGGGNGSRRRSPGRTGSRPERERGRDGDDRHRDARANGKSRDNGYEGRKTRVKEEGYGEGEREKEREGDRKRYDDGVSLRLAHCVFVELSESGGGETRST
jgi:hypothetical protein